jgi:hypothetical protein
MTLRKLATLGVMAVAALCLTAPPGFSEGAGAGAGSGEPVGVYDGGGGGGHRAAARVSKKRRTPRKRSLRHQRRHPRGKRTAY